VIEIVWFVLGLVLLALGGDSVVKGAAGLARGRGVSPFMVGLLLVAVATSLPELAINSWAMARGTPALALGNAIGSNIANVGLSLGLAALAAPLLVGWRALNPLLVVLLAATALTVALSLDGTLSNIDGVLLLLAYVAAIAFAWMRTRRDGESAPADVANFVQTGTGTGLNLLRLAIACVALYFGGRLVVDNGLFVGAAMGLAPLMAGLLPIAILTTLPEAVAAITAARRGHGDMVVGHVIGASLFNLLIVVGGIATVHGLAVPASFVRYELPFAFVFALLLVPMLRGDMRVSRREGGVLVFAFAAWVVLELVMLRG